MEPDHLKEFVNNPNGTRADIEKKSPGIVERAQTVLDHKAAADGMAARVNAVEEAKAALEQIRQARPKPKKRKTNDREF